MFLHVAQKTILALALVAIATINPAQAQGVRKRVWMTYKEGKRDSLLQAIDGNLRGSSSDIEVHYDMPRIRAVVLTATVEEILELASNPAVEAVEDDEKRYPIQEEETREFTPADTADSSQTVPYGIPMVQADAAWGRGVTGRGVKVCVMDTGIDAGHEDFITAHLTGTSPVPGLHTWYTDGIGHGTHVSGTVAAAQNGLGVVGVAPDAEIFSVKVFSNSGAYIYASSLIESAYRCLDNGATIINMSLGGSASSTAERRGFQYLRASGVLLVAAAGNSGSYEFGYPAGYPEVVSVAAVNANADLAWFSTYNEMVDIAAPGVEVLSTVPMPTAYAIYSGTSMSSPHVAGVGALLRSYMPTATVSMIENAMFMSARDLGQAGKDIYYGHGLVQAVAALDYL